MSFWERNNLFMTVSTMAAAAIYGVLVWRESERIGAIAPPSISVIFTAVIIQVVLALILIVIFSVRDAHQEGADAAIDEEDERDRQVRKLAVADASHFTGAGVFAGLIAWFWHEDGAILFHSMVAAIFFGELVRNLITYLNYRNGV